MKPMPKTDLGGSRGSRTTWPSARTLVKPDFEIRTISVEARPRRV